MHRACSTYACTQKLFNCILQQSKVFSVKMQMARFPLLLLLSACCILHSVYAQDDFSQAVQATAPPLSDNFDVSSLFGGGDENAAGNDLFNTAQTASPAYGLAPQFNATTGNLTRLRYTGTGTVAYQDRPLSTSGVVDLGCSFGYLSPDFQSAYVGVGAAFFNRAFSCGRCVKIQCDDIACAIPGKTLIAQIVDTCSDACYDADMNIAQPLFDRLMAGNASTPAPSSSSDPFGFSGSGGGSTATTGVNGQSPSLEISWDVVDCGTSINGTIKMLVKPNGSAYFQSFNFANSKQVITAVAVNGQRLRHETSNWWSWTPTTGAINAAGPFDMALLGANRQVLRVRLRQLRSQDLGVQFSSGGNNTTTAAAARGPSAERAAPIAEGPAPTTVASSPPASVTGSSGPAAVGRRLLTKN